MAGVGGIAAGTATGVVVAVAGAPVIAIVAVGFGVTGVVYTGIKWLNG